MNRRQAGFTLIELIAALAIAAALMAGLLRVVVMIRQDLQQPVGEPATPPWVDRAFHIIRHDLATGSSFLITEDGALTFEGSIAYADGTRTRQRPVQVRYEHTGDDGSGLLIRHERDLAGSSKPPQSQLIAVGISSFSIQPQPHPRNLPAGATSGASEAAGETSQITADERDTTQSAPSSVIVTLTLNETHRTYVRTLPTR